MKETKTYKVTGDTPYTPVHLKLDMNVLNHDHPMRIINSIGITCQFGTPQSIADQWWFWNCRNLPYPLPNGISILHIENPLNYVGFGLSERQAKLIIDYTP